MSIISVKPKSRNSSPVMAYWMPMTLWSVEKTYFHQKPRGSSWVSCPACGVGVTTADGLLMPLFSRSAVAMLLRGRGELEVLGLLVVGADRDRGRLRPQPLVPGGDLVGS